MSINVTIFYGFQCFISYAWLEAKEFVATKDRSIENVVPGLGPRGDVCVLELGLAKQNFIASF
jgi:hypothetical protein